MFSVLSSFKCVARVFRPTTRCSQAAAMLFELPKLYLKRNKIKQRRPAMKEKYNIHRSVKKKKKKHPTAKK